MFQSQTKKTPLVLSNKLPMILPKDANFLAMMQNLTPSMCLDQNLMPPPAVMESNGEENTKKSKLRGTVHCTHSIILSIKFGYIAY